MRAKQQGSNGQQLIQISATFQRDCEQGEQGAPCFAQTGSNFSRAGPIVDEVSNRSQLFGWFSSGQPAARLV